MRQSVVKEKSKTALSIRTAVGSRYSPRSTQCPQKFTQLLSKKSEEECVSLSSDSNFDCPFFNCKFSTPYKHNLERHVARMHSESSS